MTTPLDREVSFAWHHRVRFTRNAWNPTNPAVIDALAFDPTNDGASRALVVVDRGFLDAQPALQNQIENYFAAHREKLPTLAGFRTITGNETAKNDLSLLEGLLRDLHALQLDRRSVVIAIGGGAVLDMAGFAAAVTHRGVRLVRMPTTTLSQADSGVGVKNGVNMFGSKNFIGTFAVPHAVVNDLATLRHLPDRAWRCGLSEAVKVALLKDADFFAQIETDADALRRRDEERAAPIWQRSAELHLNHIAGVASSEGTSVDTSGDGGGGTSGGDPFELRTARPLDFGHWAAHRLEELTDYQLPHGEAVSIGLTLDLRYAAAINLLPPQVADRIVALLNNLGLPTSHPLLASDALIAGLEAFRQHLGGPLTLPLIRDIADPLDLRTLDLDTMRRCAHELAATHSHITHLKSEI